MIIVVVMVAGEGVYSCVVVWVMVVMVVKEGCDEGCGWWWWKKNVVEGVGGCGDGGGRRM